MSWKSRMRAKMNQILSRVGGDGGGNEVPPADNGAVPEEPEKVSIAEKVRFWEEQDRINQMLIPRVVQMHETVTRLAEQVEGLGTALAAAESRVVQRLASTADRMDRDLAFVRQTADGAAAEIADLRQRIDRVEVALSAHEEEAEPWNRDDARLEILRRASRAAIVACVLSVLALAAAAIALVR